MCNQPVIPEKGYFKTQLWNQKHICHVQCEPQFHYDNKPEEDSGQQSLPVDSWREQK